MVLENIVHGDALVYGTCPFITRYPVGYQHTASTLLVACSAAPLLGRPPGWELYMRSSGLSSMMMEASASRTSVSVIDNEDQLTQKGNGSNFISQPMWFAFCTSPGAPVTRWDPPQRLRSQRWKVYGIWSTWEPTTRRTHRMYVRWRLLTVNRLRLPLLHPFHIAATWVLLSSKHTTRCCNGRDNRRDTRPCVGHG